MDVKSVIEVNCALHTCPMCASNMAGSAVAVLGGQPPRYLVAVECRNCHVHMVCTFTLLTGPSRATGSEVSPISTDDVLDVKNALKDWNGSIADLVRP